MSVELAKLFIQLGVAGAALFLVYHLVNKIFTYLQQRGTADSKIDKLCDKIDKLVEGLLSTSGKTNELVSLNNQMQTMLKNSLDTQNTLLHEVHTKISAIDLRTSSCLKGEQHEKQ
jgi:hypothetical protein